MGDLTPRDGVGSEMPAGKGDDWVLQCGLDSVVVQTDAVVGAGCGSGVHWCHSSTLLISPLPRDAIAKTLYSLLFGWLTDRINKLVYPRQEALSIAILDIYGFEVGRIPPTSTLAQSQLHPLQAPWIFLLAGPQLQQL